MLNFELEKQLYDKGYKAVSGVDEVGRGCLAGPVVAAAVILNPNDIPDGINDSKKLSVKKRASLYSLIMKSAYSVSIASICATEIDQSNIRKASLKAMQKAILMLSVSTDYVLIDGRDILPDISQKQQSIVKGDSISLSIAAASIIAKVTRDNMLLKIAQLYPGYSFEDHVGYGTTKHRSAIVERGAINKIHRYSFAPIRKR